MPHIHTTDIPKIFKSDLTGDLFKQCVMCECDLLDEETNYVIEKALKPYNGLKNYATVFEYAMCMDCAESMRNVLSKESKQNIDNFFQEHVDFEEHYQKHAELDPEDILPRLEHCIVSGEHISKMAECQIYAQCVGTQLIVYIFPYMVGAKALDSMINLISNKTMDDLNDFKESFLGGPPEFEELLKSGPRVFV